jgi:SAM-dependent methyltransferase
VGLTPVQALDNVEYSVRTGGNEKDLAYFLEHRPRFERTLLRLVEIVPPPHARVLDVGSHYLHTAAALRCLGYRVTAMDVGVFAGDALMQARAAEFGIDNQVVDGFERGLFRTGETEVIDAVVFTEILEHITFNPVLFWRRIYDLLTPGGIIYITTPNVLTPWKMLHVLKRLATLQGVGLTAPEIFLTVTYGHHWKEYSAHEIRDYFTRLSPDFSVEINHYNQPERPRCLSSFKAFVRAATHALSSRVPRFREEIEAIVRVTVKTRWSVEPPKFI